MRRGVFGLRVFLATVCAAGFLASAAADHWPRFRGPNGTGVAHDKDIPVRWTADGGILWKVKLPGVGNSSPVVWGDRLFLQSSKEDGTERRLHCVSVQEGKILWTRGVPATKARHHGKNSLASSTPATDGERVYVMFWNGTAIALHAYDLEGKDLWKQDLGPFISRPGKGDAELNQHGAGTSPVVYRGKVFLNNDQTGMAELLALDAKTGKPLWKAPRKAFRTCYSVPFLLETPGKAPELVVSSTAGVTAYNPDTGAVIWNWDWTTFEKMALRTVGSPLFSNGLVIAPSGDGSGARHAVAIRPGGRDGSTQARLVWEEKRRVFPYVPSLLTHGEHLYSVQDQTGTAQCHEAKTGKLVWEQRMPGGPVSASPVLIDGKVYVISEGGSVFVFPAAPKFTLLARNDMGEGVIASPAVANGKLFIRGQEHLFCIAGAPAR